MLPRDEPSEDQTRDQLEASVEIDANPAQVWAVVSDLKRIAAFSPQVMRTWVRGKIALGTSFVNLNHAGLKVWPTTAKVVRFEPHRDFAFRVNENRVIWSFELAETPSGGTLLTQRRETPDGISQVSMVGVKYVLGGQRDFTDGLRAGMRSTLDQVKAAAEI